MVEFHTTIPAQLHSVSRDDAIFPQNSSESSTLMQICVNKDIDVAFYLHDPVRQIIDAIMSDDSRWRLFRANLADKSLTFWLPVRKSTSEVFYGFYHAAKRSVGPVGALYLVCTGLRDGTLASRTNIEKLFVQAQTGQPLEELCVGSARITFGDKDVVVLTTAGVRLTMRPDGFDALLFGRNLSGPPMEYTVDAGLPTSLAFEEGPVFTQIISTWAIKIGKMVEYVIQNPTHELRLLEMLEGKYDSVA